MRAPRGALPGLLLAALAVACAGGEPRARQLVLASTTSTEDSGLFDVLLPAFEHAHPEHDVVVIAVGTGEALELGRRKDADVVLVHAPAAESAFVARGHGVERRPVMSNDFVIAGPAADPAGIRGLQGAAAALRRIAAGRAVFVSRGDDSGTHQKELDLWRAAGLEPGGAWYVDAGHGMGEVLRIASEKEAYLLTDRGTLLSLGGVALDVLVEGDPALLNPYAVIAVAGAHNAAGAAAFVEWITGPEAQALISRFGLREHSRPLFRPEAPPPPEGQGRVGQAGPGRTVKWPCRTGNSLALAGPLEYFLPRFQARSKPTSHG